MTAVAEVPGPRPPLLVALPQIAGRKVLPKGYVHAREVFEQAMAEANADKVGPAADLFLQSAVELRVSVDDPYFKALEPLREAAYRNAWACYRSSGREADGRAKLNDAILKDLRMGKTIQNILDGR